MRKAPFSPNAVWSSGENAIRASSLHPHLTTRLESDHSEVFFSTIDWRVWVLGILLAIFSEPIECLQLPLKMTPFFGFIQLQESSSTPINYPHQHQGSWNYKESVREILGHINHTFLGLTPHKLKFFALYRGHSWWFQFLTVNGDSIYDHCDPGRSNHLGTSLNNYHLVWLIPHAFREGNQVDDRLSKRRLILGIARYVKVQIIMWSFLLPVSLIIKKVGHSS